MSDSRLNARVTKVLRQTGKLMNPQENKLRAARLQEPEYIPISFSISPGCWNYYPQDVLQDLVAEHTLLFPGHKKAQEKIVPGYVPWQRAGQPYTDGWGCVCKTTQDGISGVVVEHPLADWSAFSSFVPP